MRVNKAALGAFFLVSVAGAPTPALASKMTASLCGGTAEPAAAYPSDASLVSAGEAASALLRDAPAAGADDGGSAALAALDVPASTAQKPSPGALARYCAAAGEVMRLSPSGSQREAQVYLQSALRQSRAADLRPLSALVAYRLGVVWISGTPLTGVRGSAPPRRNGGDIVRKLRGAETSDGGSGEICSAVNQVRTDDEADPAFPMLALDCAARLALETGQPGVSALATLRYARFALEWRDSSDDPEALIQDARARTLAAIPVAKSIPDPKLRTELLARLAQTAIELGAGTEEQLLSVPSILRSAGTDPAAQSAAYTIEAQLALARNDQPAARALLEKAILQESARPLPIGLPRMQLLLAKADPARRQQHVADAYVALENLRPSLPRLDPLTEESMFALHMRQVFEAAADAQLKLAEGAQSGPRVATAQEIVEAFREAELQSAVGSECLPPRVAVDPRHLAENEILLYPLLFDDRLELIYVRGGTGASSGFRRLAPNISTNKRQVAKLVDTIKLQLTLGAGDKWREPAKQLYALLIKPIEAELSERSTLAIIPDGPLRGTPFAALLSGDGRYLVERTALTVAPALAYSQPGSLHGEQKLHIVAASLARKVSVPQGEFSALTGTKTEAQIAAANGRPGTLVPDFTREQLVAALSRNDVDVLHLATHAAFNGRSDRAFIVANGEVIRLSELRDILSQNRARGELLDLLVLSACETAVGDDEASMGLAGAAVQAGALSALASLWQVDDVGTAELMRQFYRNYAAGNSRAQSLRQAQLAMIRKGGDQADPFVWAAFTLLGAWR